MSPVPARTSCREQFHFAPANMNPESETDSSKYTKLFSLFSDTSSTLDSKKFMYSSSSLPFSMKKDSGSCPYLVSTINTVSQLGFIPFRIKVVERSDSQVEYKIHPVNPFRKFVCLLIHLGAIAGNALSVICEILFANPTELSSNFTLTFDVVTYTGALLLVASFVNTFWRHQDKLLEIVQESRVRCGDRTQQRKQETFVMLAIIAIYIINIFSFVTYNQPGDVTKAIDHLRFEDTGSVGDYVLYAIKVAVFAFKHHSYAMNFISYCFLMMLSLTMKEVKREFCEEMNESLVAVDMKTGFDRYTALKQLSSNVTGTFGNKILIYYIVSVSYFAKIPQDDTWKQIGQTTSMITYFGMGAVIWLVSAEFHMNVRDVIQNWATQMQDLDDLTIDMRIRLLSVVNDNLLDPVGISCKFFTITYGFLGSMLGLIVTYAIIVFQMQSKPLPTSATPTSISSYFKDDL